MSRLAFLAGMLLLLPFLAPGGVGPAQAQQAAALASSPAEAPPRPGDVVRLKIWREPEMSGDFTVSERGTVVLPRLGETEVGQYSVSPLREHLVESYGQFLNHRSIEVVLLRRVQVSGAVKNPGLYTVEPTLSLADVVALAGGATVQGRLDRLELVRDGVRTPLSLSSPEARVESALRSGDQLWVPERSWVSRNTGIVATGITAGVSLVIALFVR